MANKFADAAEYERIKSFIKMKAGRSVTLRVECSANLIRPLSFSDRDRLNDELREEGIVVEWVIHS